VNYPGGFNLSRSEYMASLLSTGIGEVLTAWDGDALVGAFGMVVSADPFSGWLTAAEQWWFVLPSHRKSTAGLRLFSAFEEEAKIRGCKKLMMVTLAGDFEGRLTALYESKGYTPVERSFWKLI
jgi:GNAT superfamily N-acetyltransferase